MVKDNQRLQKYGFGRSTAQKAVWSYRKEKSNAAANSAIRNTGRVLTYNPNAQFKIKIDGYSEEVLDGLSAASKKVAYLGGKDGKEHLILVDLSNGTNVYAEKGNDVSVGYEEFRNYIKQHPNQQLAFIHNHNTDGYFSESDMRTLLTTQNIEMFVAVRIDGIIYILLKKHKLLLITLCLINCFQMKLQS